jgi:heme/copper-type cytochrome/quinol oxidase subunit 1
MKKTILITTSLIFVFLLSFTSLNAQTHKRNPNQAKAVAASKKNTAKNNAQLKKIEAKSKAVDHKNTAKNKAQEKKVNAQNNPNINKTQAANKAQLKKGTATKRAKIKKENVKINK